MPEPYYWYHTSYALLDDSLLEATRRMLAGTRRDGVNPKDLVRQVQAVSVVDCLVYWSFRD